MPLIAGLPAVLALAALIAYWIWPRCNLYEYVKIWKIRWPVLIGRIRKDGTFLDLTKPWGMRRVGQFTFRDHKGVLRLYNLGLGDGEAADAGDVAPRDRAPVTATGGALVDEVERQGYRKWWDLFLRLHAPVLPKEIPPSFKVIEYGRFKRATSNVMTLLAEGGAAILLYKRWGTADTLPYRDPAAKWDTALPAALLFGLLFIPLSVRLWFWNHPFNLLHGVSGHFAPGFSLFLGIWVVLYLLKRTLLSLDDRVLDYLILLNRATGQHLWAPVGLLVSVLLAILSLLREEQRAFVPLYAATTIGFLAVWLFAPGDPWPVKLRAFTLPDPRLPQPPLEGDISKHYSWSVDGGFRAISLAADVPFAGDEIDAIRRLNPFHENPDAATKAYPSAMRQIVSKGRLSRQVQTIVDTVSQAARDNELSTFEVIQSVLGLAQEPTIGYALDNVCEEIGNPPEYCRLAAETLWDQRGDCDCKSALTATVLKALGFPVLVLLSARVEHAAIAVGGIPADMPREGLLWFEYQGELYYFCETTGAGWRVGQPSQLAQAVLADKGGIVDVN
jgi:hypothetical protein